MSEPEAIDTKETAYQAAEAANNNVNNIAVALSAAGYYMPREHIKAQLIAGKIESTFTGLPDNLSPQQRTRLQQITERHLRQHSRNADIRPIHAEETPAHYGSDSDLAPIVIGKSVARRHIFASILHHPFQQGQYEFLYRLFPEYRPESGVLSISYEPANPKLFWDSQPDPPHRELPQALFEIAMAPNRNGNLRPAILPRFGDTVVSEDQKSQYRETNQWRLAGDLPVTPEEPWAAVTQAFRYGINRLCQALGQDPQPAMATMAETENAGTHRGDLQSLPELERELISIIRKMPGMIVPHPAGVPIDAYAPRSRSEIRTTLHRLPQRYDRVFMRWNPTDGTLEPTAPPVLENAIPHPGFCIPCLPELTVAIDHDRISNASVVQAGQQVPDHVITALLKAGEPTTLTFPESGKARVNRTIKQWPALTPAPGQAPKTPSIRKATEWEVSLGLCLSNWVQERCVTK